MEKTYAQALFTLSQKQGASADELVKALVTHLKEMGREKLLPRILLELKRLDARSASFGEVLEVASEAEKTLATKEAKELGITADAIVNGQLVTGWRARSGSRVIDRSGKRALLDLYRTIATRT
jgi:F0F1-type ATP synthase delta subunit